VSLGSLLGVAADTATPSGFVLIPRAAGCQIGLRADRVEQFLEIRSDDLTPPASISRFLKSVAPGPLGLLHMEAVLKEIYSGAGFSIEESNV
jgi:chemotaxis signal transduction protein